MSGAAITVDAVTFRYPGTSRAVLEHLSLRIEAGERVAILGPNGSGKTTLALHLNGLLELQQGSIRLDEHVLDRRSLAEFRRRIGIVFQDPDDQLFMHTVADDVAFGPANLGLDAAERDRRVDEALAAVHAGHLRDHAPHHLSGGEKRRIAIATTLAMRPDVLVLDEPTAGLDPRSTRRLAELLRELDHTLVVVTHDLPFALATCQRAVILDGGQVVADGPIDDLLDDVALLEAHDLELPFGYGHVR